MARGKGGLGRGLDSLFDDAAPVFESGAKVDTLPLREIEPVSYTHLDVYKRQGNVHDDEIGVGALDLGLDGREQMGLAKAGAAVDEQLSLIHI